MTAERLDHFAPLSRLSPSSALRAGLFSLEVHHKHLRSRLQIYTGCNVTRFARRAIWAPRSAQPGDVGRPAEPSPIDDGDQSRPMSVYRCLRADESVTSG